MPEPGVQQVQHGVLDTADVQVNTTAVGRRAGAGPIALVVNVAELVSVGGVNVTQLVPGRTSPLRHDVRVTGIPLQPIAEV